LPSLIDKDTPDDARTRTGFDGQKYNLVFSDEFEVEGRTFYPGDDPFWEGVDYHYWPTGDLEWYDPGESNLSFKVTQAKHFPQLNSLLKMGLSSSHCKKSAIMT
jgi:beta-glucanase (GH16 family)